MIQDLSSPVSVVEAGLPVVVEAGLPVVQVLIMYRKEWELYIRYTDCML